MKRRNFIKSAITLPALATLGTLAHSSAVRAAAGVAPWSNGTEWKLYEITHRVEVPAGDGPANAWIPLPSVLSDYSRPLGNEWSGNVGAQILHNPRYGSTAMLYAQMPAGDTPRWVEVTSRVSTRDRAVDLARPQAFERTSAGELSEYLKSTELLPTDGIVRSTALKAVGKAKTDVDKARAIYEWIVDNTFRDAKTRGCGQGDIKAMLETGNLGGKCADLNALFVGMARAVGVPARDVYGVRLSPSKWDYRSMSASGNVTRAQHCRAEFYSASHGWVPVDPADVRKVILEEPPGNLAATDPKVKLAREKLFGAWEMNWLAYNTSHDIKLPNSKGAALGFLMYPQVETANARKDPYDPDNVKYVITSKPV
jgi:transglutaminase-like putative cysteine protease